MNCSALVLIPRVRGVNKSTEEAVMVMFHLIYRRMAPVES